MRHYVFSLLILLVLTAAQYSCTSGNYAIGETIQPAEDTVWTATNTFKIKSKTVLVDSILQRNRSAILGAYTDPVYGTTKSDFFTQLYCPDGFSFSDSIIDDKIDSAFLYLFFDDYYGDTLSLFEASVYELDKALDLQKLYYTNIDVNEYCSGKELGRKSFTIHSSNDEWTDNYDKCIRIPIDLAFAQKFYEDNRDHPEYFLNLQNFTEYFKGFYVTTNYGNGAFVYIEDMELEFIYKYRYTDTDSLGVEYTRDTTAASYFLYSREVRQVNTYAHPDLSRYISLEESDTLNYLYAPAGMYTRVEISMKDIYELLPGTNINYAQVKMTATDIEDELWSMDPPSQLLLIGEESMNSFFANYSLQDKYSSFTASYNESDTCFVFDVSPLVQKYIRKWDKDQTLLKTDPDTVLELMVVPVSTITNDDKTSLYLLPDTDPCAVKIRSASHPKLPMRLDVVASKK